PNRKRQREQPVDLVVERRLGWARLVEAPPASEDQLGGAGDHLLARGIEPERRVRAQGSSTSTRPSTIRVAYTTTGSVAGPSSASPLVRSNSAPWQAQRTAPSSTQPSPSGHSWWVHQPSTACQLPSTRATAASTSPWASDTGVSSGRSEAVASIQVTGGARR